MSWWCCNAVLLLEYPWILLEYLQYFFTLQSSVSLGPWVWALQNSFATGQVHTALQPLLGHGDHSLSPVCFTGVTSSRKVLEQFMQMCCERLWMCQMDLNGGEIGRVFMASQRIQYLLKKYSLRQHMSLLGCKTQPRQTQNSPVCAGYAKSSP